MFLILTYCPVTQEIPHRISDLRTRIRHCLSRYVHRKVLTAQYLSSHHHRTISCRGTIQQRRENGAHVVRRVSRPARPQHIRGEALRARRGGVVVRVHLLHDDRASQPHHRSNVGEVSLLLSLFGRIMKQQFKVLHNMLPLIPIYVYMLLLMLFWINYHQATHEKIDATSFQTWSMVKVQYSYPT